MVGKSDFIAIIPARGGSKRIPKKNIIDFHGKPMIAWTIGAAIESGIFSRVHVSTDDKEIADIAVQFGAEVPFLRQSCADDHSTVSDAVIWHLSQMSAEPSLNVVMLMPNCPLRDADNIKSIENYYSQEPNTSVISAFDYGFCNPWWAHQVDAEGRAKPLIPQGMGSRSQDLQRLLCPTGAVWMSSVEQLMIEKTFYSQDYHFFEIPFSNAVDIDNYDDLRLAQALRPKLVAV